MFNTVTLLKQEAIAGNKLRATYQVTDSCFKEHITLEYQPPVHENESVEPAAVLLIYMNRKLNVARNLALYYIGIRDVEIYMAADKALIDRQFPSLNYGKSIHRLVKLYHNDMKQVIDDYTTAEEALMQAIKEKLNLKAKH